MIEKKVFKVPTAGERGNPNNPLHTLVPGVRHLNVLEYVEDDKFAIVVAFKYGQYGFEPFKDFEEIHTHDVEVSNKKIQKIRAVDDIILESTDETEIGKKHYELLGISKTDWEKSKVIQHD